MRHGFQKRLLCADAAEVLPPAVAGVVVVVAEAHDLHGLLAVKLLQSCLEVDVQVLIGVVVVHVAGHVELNAADLVDERDEAL